MIVTRRNRKSQIIIATPINRLKILLTKSGIFWGRRGDYLLKSNGYHWIVEQSVFFDLYQESGGGNLEHE